MAAFILLPVSAAVAQGCVWTRSGDFVCGGNQPGYDFPETVLTDLPPEYDPEDEPVPPLEDIDTELDLDSAMFQIMEALGSLPVCQQIDASEILNAWLADIEAQYPDDYDAQNAAIEAYPPPYLEVGGVSWSPQHGIYMTDVYFLGERIETPPSWVYSPELNKCVPPANEAISAINDEIANLPVCQQQEAAAILETLVPGINDGTVDTSEPPYITQEGDVTYLLGEPLTTPYYYVPRFGDNTPAPPGFGNNVTGPYTGNCGPPGENTRDAIVAAIAAELTACQQTEANGIFDADMELLVMKGELVPDEPYIVDLGGGVFSFLGTTLTTNAAAVPPGCL